MPIDKETFSQKLEEFKENGHEYRYREQLIVQEFSLSMIATGVVINALTPRQGAVEAFIIQIFGLVFLVLLTLHLRNLNQDRIAAATRKGDLARDLEFVITHQNPDGKKRVRAKRLMVLFSCAVAFVWAIWTVTAIKSLIAN